MILLLNILNEQIDPIGTIPLDKTPLFSFHRCISNGNRLPYGMNDFFPLKEQVDRMDLVRF